MAELHTATLVADADLLDDVEVPMRKGTTAGLLKLTLLKIKTYIFAKLYAYNAPVVVAYAADLTMDFSTGLNFKIGDLTGAITLENPTNTTPGQSGVIFFKQDATGGRLITYGTNWKFPGGVGTGGVLSTGAAAIDMLSYFVRADGTLACAMAKDIKS